MSLNNVLVCQARLRKLCGIIFANNIYHVAAKRLTSSNFSFALEAELNQYSNYYSYGSH